MAKKRRRFATTGGLTAALLVAAVVAFAPALHAPFVSDDKLAISDNEHVVANRGIVETFSSFSWWGRSRADAPGYRPLATWSFAATWALVGADPLAYHLTNIALHALVVLLVRRLALRLGFPTTEAWLAAAAFALLPIHSEAVIWSVGRAELMAAVCWLGAFCALLDYRREGRGPALLAAAVWMGAGLFSKENTITLLAAPGVLALFMPLTRRTRRRDAAAFAVLLLVAAAYLATRWAAGPMLPTRGPDLLDNPISVIEGPLARLSAALSVFGRYLKLTVWPHPMSIDYSYDALGMNDRFAYDAYTFVGASSAAALIAVAWLWRRARPGVSVALVMAMASYSIVSNTLILIGTAMAERLFYLPTVGLCLASAPALATLGRAAAGRGRYAVAVVALLLLAIDWSRAAQWTSPVSLFESAVRAHPRSARAQMELGVAYGAAGRAEDAVAAFARATDIKPDYAAAWYNLGNFYARGGRSDQAAESYQTALEHAPKLVPAWFNLGMVYRVLGRFPDAAGAFATAVRITPDAPDAQLAYGDTLLALGRNREAVEAYTAGLEAGGDRVAALINRGVARQRLSGCAAAVDDYVAALEIRADHTTALGNAVECLRELGRERDASALIAASGLVANRNTGR